MSEKNSAPNKAKTSQLTCAIDLCRGGILAALVDERARIVASRQAELPESGGKAAIQEITKLLLQTCAAAERGDAEINAVGVCIPGTVDHQAGRVTAPALKWDRLALRELIERSIEESGVDIRRAAATKSARAEKKESSLPLITITSDALASVTAETWCGTAAGKQHVIFISVGRKIEAGIIAEGKLIQGAGGIAGAAGWFALSEGYREEYATRGCLETEAAAAAMVRRTIEGWSGETNSLLGHLLAEEPAQLTPAAIIRAARSGDALAVQVISEISGWIGRGIADLISIFNPEVVVIGGEIGVAWRPYLTEVRNEARLWAHPVAARQCRILTATLGKNIGLLGAAQIASAGNQS